MSLNGAVKDSHDKAIAAWSVLVATHAMGALPTHGAGPSPAVASGPGEVWQAARSAFSEFMLHEMEKIADDVPRDLAQEYATRASNAFDEVVDRIFGHADAPAPGPQAMEQAIVQANSKGLQALRQLQVFASSQQSRAQREHQRGPDPCPQAIVGHGIGVQVIRRTPQVEHLVLRGGGAKGVGYPAALTALERAGRLDGVRHLYGSSAGALAATCLACGQSAEAMGDFCRGVALEELAREPADFQRRYPQVGIGRLGRHHGGRALELMDELSAREVSAYLTAWLGHGNHEALPTPLTDKELGRLRRLAAQDFGPGVDRSPMMVTFGDLALLHRIDPRRFKLLTLTGYEASRHKTHYFSADATPDMPVAVAARISMSIPGYYRAVDFDLGQGRRTFRDGGIKDPLPVGAVDRRLLAPWDARDADQQELRARTAVLTFDEGGAADDALQVRQVSAMTWLSRRLDPWTAGAATQSKVRQAGINAFVVGHGDLSSLDFDASPERIARARGQAALKMAEQLAGRSEPGEGYAVTYRSPEDCFAHLTAQERQALASAPEPSGTGAADLFQRRLQQLAREQALGRPLSPAPGSP